MRIAWGRNGGKKGGKVTMPQQPPAAILLSIDNDGEVEYLGGVEMLKTYWARKYYFPWVA